MLALHRDAAAAYRSAAFDARVRGAGSTELVLVCLDQFVDGLGQALLAHERGDTSRRAEGVTRALAALTALDMGIDRQGSLAAALVQLYGAARQQVLASVTDFVPAKLVPVRQDFAEIAQAFRQGQAG